MLFATSYFQNISCMCTCSVIIGRRIVRWCNELYWWWDHMVVLFQISYLLITADVCQLLNSSLLKGLLYYKCYPTIDIKNCCVVLYHVMCGVVICCVLSCVVLYNVDYCVVVICCVVLCIMWFVILWSISNRNLKGIKEKLTITLTQYNLCYVQNIFDKSECKAMFLWTGQLVADALLVYWAW